MVTIRYAAACCALVPALAASAHAEDKPRSTEQQLQHLLRFETQVEQIRTELRIPGMSAVIVRDQEVLWSKGFGFADADRKIPATPETLYHVASLTKTLGATLVLQLVEQGKLDLDEAVSGYSTEVQGDAVRIKHLLSHTSEGTPGDDYHYNGNRFNFLTAVLEKKTGKPIRTLMVETFLDPLGMSASVPSHDILDPAAADSVDAAHRDRYRKNLEKLAVPYTLYGTEVIPAPYPPRSLGVAAGLLSTVLDMARFDAAIDRHQYLKKETQDRAWTRFVSNRGKSLPHGLGWFVQDYEGEKLIWHYGHWGTGFSATYLKVPGKGLSLILVGNSEALSDPWSYSDGRIETNAFACVFLRLFVLEDMRGRALPDPDWSRGPREFADEVKRLNKQAGGSGYEGTRDAHDAVTRWLDSRRAHARVAIQVDPRTYDAYLGRYELNPRRTFTARLAGDRLIMDFNRGEAELFPEAVDTYFTKVWDIQVTFGRDDSGKVTHLDIVVDGQPPRRAKRVP